MTLLPKASLFAETFNRLSSSISEINICEIFVAIADEIDADAMFDLEGKDLCVRFTDGSIAYISGPSVN
jgi:hypothetical protein